ncbi:MAG: MBL fold metallo-hydrolase [Deltaproteobacteria bacterium]|nr:MBL fold metallo-hydrolase [Deltaproteobacteria bacterium]
MRIRQFRYAADNLAYLIYGENAALAVDPGAVEDMLTFLEKSGLTLQAVVNTHSHPDHTTGNKSILEQTKAVFMDTEILLKEPFLELEGDRIAVYHTPGHTQDSVIFQVDRSLVTGDTLFTGKAGRCFTGDLARFLKSIKRIMAFPSRTVIYGGHDYVLEYMDTAKAIEPNNTAIDDFLETYTPDHVCSTLADEYRINPTLRFNTDSLIHVLKERGLATATEYERWQSVMSIV